MSPTEPSARARVPPRWALGLLLASTIGTPFVARLREYPVGDWAMFSSIERYHLDLSVSEPTGTTIVPVRSLAPHLSRDAKFVILPGASNGFGKDQTDLLAGGLADIGALLCELHPAASSADVRLGRGPLPRQGAREPAERGPLYWTEASVRCLR